MDSPRKLPSCVAMLCKTKTGICQKDGLLGGVYLIYLCYGPAVYDCV